MRLLRHLGGTGERNLRADTFRITSYWMVRLRLELYIQIKVRCFNVRRIWILKHYKCFESWREKYNLEESDILSNISEESEQNSLQACKVISRSRTIWQYTDVFVSLWYAWCFRLQWPNGHLHQATYMSNCPSYSLCKTRDKTMGDFDLPICNDRFTTHN